MTKMCVLSEKNCNSQGSKKKNEYFIVEANKMLRRNNIKHTVKTMTVNI